MEVTESIDKIFAGLKKASPTPSKQGEKSVREVDQVKRVKRKADAGLLQIHGTSKKSKPRRNGGAEGSEERPTPKGWTEDGLPIYSLDQLRIGEDLSHTFAEFATGQGGNSPKCPFLCDCLSSAHEIIESKALPII